MQQQIFPRYMLNILSTLCFGLIGAASFAILHSKPIRGDTWLVFEVALGAFSCLYCTIILKQEILASVTLSTRVVVWQLVGHVTTALLFRLSSLHPLSKYPGPVLARCTSLYLTYAVWTGKRHKLFLALHRRYGDFVRIGPNTVSINRNDAITTTYNNANCWNKTDAYHLGGLSGAGLFFIEDLEEHNKRKRHWIAAFTTESLFKYRPMLERKTNELLESVQVHAKLNNGIVELSLLLQYWAHDVTGELSFGDTWGYNFCKDGDQINLLEATELETATFEILGQAPSLSHLMWYFPLTRVFRVMDRICGKAIEKRRKLGSQSPDIMGHLLGEHSKSGQTLPEIHLKQEGALVILAGTNGVSSALSITLYHLASQPATYQNLKKELQESFPFYDPLVPLDAGTLSKLPYLNAVVNEGLRMGAPLGNFPRVAPKGGSVVSGEFIPEGCIVSVPAWAQQVSGNNFYPHPESFIPERWLAEGLGKGSILNRNAIMTFSHGPFGCIGKTLVYQEMHLVIAKMLLAFDFRFPPNYDQVSFFEGIENRRTTRFTVPLQLLIH